MTSTKRWNALDVKVGEELKSAELSERLNVVCRIEADPVVLPSLAPALLVLILKLLKLVSCNNKTSFSFCSWVCHKWTRGNSLQCLLYLIWKWVHRVQQLRNRRAHEQEPPSRRCQPERLPRRPTPPLRHRRQMDCCLGLALRYWRKGGQEKNYELIVDTKHSDCQLIC